MEARCAETQILTCKERKLQKKQRIMEITELIMQVLKSKNWGVYYKSHPIQPLETKDGTALYKVNQVDEREIEQVIVKNIKMDKAEGKEVKQKK